MKFLPESCSSKYVINLAAKKWEREREREISWNQTWAKIQWKPEQECVRGGVSACVSMRELNTPLDPYLKRRWRMHQRRGKPQWLWSRWRRWGPGAIGPGSADLWGRPALGWAPWCPPFGLVLPQWLSSLKIWCTAKSLLEKMSKLFFPKDFKTQKIFLAFFCKKGKSC